MEKMKSTAKKLDVLCNVLQICCWIAGVAATVGILLIAAFFAFDLAPEQIGSGYNAVDMGFLELMLAEAVTPEPAKILLISLVDMAMGVVLAILAWLSIRCVRQILIPMQAGLPFQNEVVAGLKKLALYTVIMGVVANVVNLISHALTLGLYQLPQLLVGEKITGVEVNFTFDLTFLVVSAVSLLLSYVFSYGAVLQQQSDETL